MRGRAALSTLAKASGFWATITALVTLAILSLELGDLVDELVVFIMLLGVLVVVGARHHNGLLHPWRRGGASVAAYASTRYLVLAVITTHAWADRDGAALLLLAIALNAVAVGIESLVGRIKSKARPYAANIPGVRTWSNPRFRTGPHFAMNFIALVVLLLSAYVAPSLVGVSLITGALLILYGLAIILDVLSRLHARLTFEVTLESVVDSLAPVFILHWNAPKGTAYQVGMWLPYLERLGVPFIVVVRNSDNFREVANLTKHPILLRVAMESLDTVVRPSVRGVFYVNNAIRNAHFIRYAHLTHIQLNHGDSDKAPSFNPMFRMYDRDFVAGQAAIDRFRNNNVSMPDGIFTIVGRPQVEHVLIESQPVAEQSEPVVLYAPTWGGFHQDSQYSSLPHGPEIISGLLEASARVVFRPHAYYRRSPELSKKRDEVIALLREDEARTGRKHLYGTAAEVEMSVTDCFNAADALISDVSSIVGDFLFSEKPLAMVAVSHAPDEFVVEFPMALAAYVINAHEETVVNLEECLDELLRRDSKSKQRRSLKTYYLGDIPSESYSQRFHDEALGALRLDDTPASR